MASVAIVIGIFFAIGIVVGIVGVIAMSVVRRGDRDDLAVPGDPDNPPRYWPDGPGESSAHDWDSSRTEEHSRWKSHAND
jgi:hypothetical protein